MDNRKKVNDLISRAWNALQEIGFVEKTDLDEGFELLARGRFRIMISKQNKSGKTTDVYLNNWITFIRYAVHKAKFEPGIWDYKMKRIYHKKCIHTIVYERN